MSFYLTVRALSGPAYAGLDANNRPMFSFSIDALAAAPVADFEDEIIKLLSDAGLATFSTSPTVGDTFKGPGVFPVGDGPFIRVTDTGGSSPDLTRDPTDSYENLSMRIGAVGIDFQVTKDRLIAIQRELFNITNQTLSA